MGFFTVSKEEKEKIRGVSDSDLIKKTNVQLLCIAIARMMEGSGVDDEVLIQELYKRGKNNNN